MWKKIFYKSNIFNVKPRNDQWSRGEIANNRCDWVVCRLWPIFPILHSCEILQARGRPRIQQHPQKVDLYESHPCYKKTPFLVHFVAESEPLGGDQAGATGPGPGVCDGEIFPLKYGPGPLIHIFWQSKDYNTLSNSLSKTIDFWWLFHPKIMVV